MKDKDKYHFMIVGDVHGHYAEYLETIRVARYSLQLGDLGFNYAPLVRNKFWNPDRHKFLPGNHDNYTVKETTNPPEIIDPYGKYVVEDGKVYEYTQLPNNFIGNYGVWKVPNTKPGGVHGDSIFFVRGAWSIDWKWRTRNIDIWEHEELTYQECEDAIKMYEEVKPSLVVTHACPCQLENHLVLGYGDGKPISTRTGMCLGRMFDIHKPKLWVFGHYHQEFDKEIEGCRFVCLEELAFMCFDEQLNPVKANSDTTFLPITTGG